MAESVAQKQHWSEMAESTTVVGVWLLVYAYRFGGRLLFKVLLAPVIAFYYLSNRRARAATFQYLERLHRFNPAMPAPRWYNGMRIFWEFGVVIIDKFAVWMGHIQRDDVTIHGNHLIDTQLQKKQGAVLLLSHLGNFEICQALARTHPGVKLSVLVHTHNAEQFNAILQKFNSEGSFELLQVSEFDAASSIMLSERVSRGEFIAVAGDRVPFNSAAVTKQNFLGQSAPFPTGAFLLSTVLSVPIIMTTCIKRRGRYQIHFDHLGGGEHIPRKQRAARVDEMVRKYVQALQAYVQQAPLQWFNFFDFWNVPHEPSNETGRKE